MEGLRYVQANLQHCIAATAILARELTANKYDIALIQEPYLYKGEVKGLGGTEGGGQGIIIASAYLPYEETDPVSGQLQDLISYSSQVNMELIIGCDANAHNTAWGSTGNNVRGDKLLDYLVSSTMHIVNRGNKPTFVTARRKEVIDITLANSRALRKITNWYVSDEITLSDHKRICFTYRTKGYPGRQRK
ncbi:hypothetical protein ABMA27_008734 [Loxostege sticticalis]|uniref:Endonuclease/exonuclease/phosphatase domain-containing protein n=1 Tax=Loxostege sticticalis TaxID=481309 RepID=A0ABR3HCG0_LOXSC